MRRTQTHATIEAPRSPIRPRPSHRVPASAAATPTDERDRRVAEHSPVAEVLEGEDVVAQSEHDPDGEQPHREDRRHDRDHAEVGRSAQHEEQDQTERHDRGSHEQPFGGSPIRRRPERVHADDTGGELPRDLPTPRSVRATAGPVSFIEMNKVGSNVAGRFSSSRIASYVSWSTAPWNPRSPGAPARIVAPTATATPTIAPVRASVRRHASPRSTIAVATAREPSVASPTHAATRWVPAATPSRPPANASGQNLSTDRDPRPRSVPPCVAPRGTPASRRGPRRSRSSGPSPPRGSGSGRSRDRCA